MIHPDAIALIQRCEGFRSQPYLCPAGVPTIGYGHVLHPKDAFSSITEEEASLLLMQDLERVQTQVARLITVPLTQHQEGALISFTYNLGSGALQRSSLRQKINRLEHEEAGEEFGKWIWAAGRKLPGLILRRALESAMYKCV
jgi:lysozyme